MTKKIKRLKIFTPALLCKVQGDVAWDHFQMYCKILAKFHWRIYTVCVNGKVLGVFFSDYYAYGNDDSVAYCYFVNTSLPTNDFRITHQGLLYSTFQNIQRTSVMQLTLCNWRPIHKKGHWKLLSSMVLILWSLQSSQLPPTLYESVWNLFYSKTITIYNAMAISTLGCNGFDMYNKHMRFPYHPLCSICANIHTVFPTKSFISHVWVSQLENIFSRFMYRYRFAHLHFVLQLDCLSCTLRTEAKEKDLQRLWIHQVA
jgi:hypothetical protein